MSAVRVEYPERAITIAAGFDPGAATEITTWTLAAGAKKYLDKPIVIENKGGDGKIANRDKVTGRWGGVKVYLIRQ